MGVRGSLSDMDLSSLISVNCNEGHQSRLRLLNGEQEAFVYFEQYQIAHAELGDKQGEEVIYEILGWEDGTFEIDMDIPPPAHTVTTAWTNLVLEGMRLLDEAQLEEAIQDKEVVENNSKQEVPKMAKRRSEILAEQLENLLMNSAEVNGAVVVGADGLVLAANLPSTGYDPNRVGAEGAALMGLSRRTLSNLNSGNFETAILQGSDGWIVALGAGSRAVLLGMTPPNVNIGMALIEMRDTASEIASTLG